jgi:hypothetical protein
MLLAPWTIRKAQSSGRFVHRPAVGTYLDAVIPGCERSVVGDFEEEMSDAGMTRLLGEKMQGRRST